MTDAQKPMSEETAEETSPSEHETVHEAEVENGTPTRANPRKQTVLVVGPDGKPMGVTEVKGERAQEGGETGEEGETEDDNDPSKLVEQPAKVMRIGSMIKQLLEEVRAAPLDEAGRVRLREIHARSIAELEDGLAPELRDELDRLSLPFSNEAAPSEPELRIAQAQLVGWLEGLFHGIQAALVAQQMAARIQIEQMQRMQRTPQLPAGLSGQEHTHGDDHDMHTPGQYL